jgi:hypothetical protein
MKRNLGGTVSAKRGSPSGLTAASRAAIARTAAAQAAIDAFIGDLKVPGVVIVRGPKREKPARKRSHE